MGRPTMAHPPVSPAWSPFDEAALSVDTSTRASLGTASIDGQPVDLTGRPEQCSEGSGWTDR